MALVDAARSNESSRKLFNKAGLLPVVESLRGQIKELKRNAVQQITQAVLRPLLSRFSLKLKLCIRAHK